MPADLAEAVRAAAEGRGRRELAGSASRLSEHYRERGASRTVIGAADDAVAYALSRMPATFAAVTAVLLDLSERAPNFAPRTLLDAGAGPGTASWAAREVWSEVAPTLLDENQHFLDLARAISPDVKALRGDLRELGVEGAFDLVTCAYALTELEDGMLAEVGRRLWDRTAGALLIVEPGRPRDYQRLMLLRRQLLEAGAEILGPCPHADACPLVEPDWCHFSVRLNRSRDHRQLKQASLAYEDEKFSYLLVARPGMGAPAPARIIKPTRENKFSVTLPLCRPDGTAVDLVVERRNGAVFKAAKKAQWGNKWPKP